MVGVSFKGCGVRTVERERAVAIQTKLVGGLAELSIIFGAMNIVTGEAGDAAPVHEALRKIVALHAVFVGGAIGEMCERSCAEGVFFELPIIAKICADLVADWPIVIFALDGIARRASLGMTLDAGVVGGH